LIRTLWVFQLFTSTEVFVRILFKMIHESKRKLIACVQQAWMWL
jgi:hypothetical protein